MKTSSIIRYYKNKEGKLMVNSINHRFSGTLCAVKGRNHWVPQNILSFSEDSSKIRVRVSGLLDYHEKMIPLRNDTVRISKPKSGLISNSISTLYLGYKSSNNWKRGLIPSNIYLKNPMKREDSYDLRYIRGGMTINENTMSASNLYNILSCLYNRKYFTVPVAMDMIKNLRIRSLMITNNIFVCLKVDYDGVSVGYKDEIVGRIKYDRGISEYYPILFRGREYLYEEIIDVFHKRKA